MGLGQTLSDGQLGHHPSIGVFSTSICEEKLSDETRKKDLQTIAGKIFDNSGLRS
jgi:hypothetical protein